MASLTMLGEWVSLNACLAHQELTQPKTSLSLFPPLSQIMFWIASGLKLNVTRLSVVVTLLCACVLAYQTGPVKLLSNCFFAECETSEGETRGDTTEEVEALVCRVRTGRSRVETREPIQVRILPEIKSLQGLEWQLGEAEPRRNPSHPECLRC